MESRSTVTRSQLGKLRVEDRREESSGGETRVMDELGAGMHRVPLGESRALSDTITLAPTTVGTVLFDRLRRQPVVLASGVRTLAISSKSETFPTVSGEIAQAERRIARRDRRAFRVHAVRDRARRGVLAVTQPKRRLDPERTYHLQVKVGKTVVYQELAFGDRCTLQVPGRDVEQLLAGGGVELVDPHELPDLAER